MLSTEQYIDRWRVAGVISGEQSTTLAALARKERFSVFLELSALLYLGVVAFAAGLGWTVREHFASLGDAAILVSLAALVTGTFAYCFVRATPYSNVQVESSDLLFDYVLYLGCLAFGVALGYAEYRFHLLKDSWDLYLLASAVVYFAAAYRFDNRFVLSLALSALAGWFGVRLTSWHVLPEAIRGLAIVYGAMVAAIGVITRRRGVKPHFVDTYLHVAANASLLALTSGAIETDSAWFWQAGLLVAGGGVAWNGVRYRQFAFVAYGVVYAYVGISGQITHHIASDTSTFAYFVASGCVVIAILAWTALRFGREG